MSAGTNTDGKIMKKHWPLLLLLIPLLILWIELTPGTGVLPRGILTAGSLLLVGPLAVVGWCIEGGARPVARFVGRAWELHWFFLLLLIPAGSAWMESRDAGAPGERWLMTFILGLCFIPLGIGGWIQQGGAYAIVRALAALWMRLTRRSHACPSNISGPT